MVKRIIEEADLENFKVKSQHLLGETYQVTTSVKPVVSAV